MQEPYTNEENWQEEELYSQIGENKYQTGIAFNPEGINDFVLELHGPFEQGTGDIWELAEELNEEGYDIVNAEGTSHEDLDEFIEKYNNDRLHQGINFVTPQEKHSDKAEKIIKEREKKHKQAIARRKRLNRKAKAQAA